MSPGYDHLATAVSHAAGLRDAMDAAVLVDEKGCVRCGCLSTRESDRECPQGKRVRTGEGRGRKAHLSYGLRTAAGTVRPQAPTAHQSPAPTSLSQPIVFTINRCVDSQGIDGEERGGMAKFQPEIRGTAEPLSRGISRKPRQPCGSRRIGKRREGFCAGRLVEMRGIEPLTFALRTRRSPS